MGKQQKKRGFTIVELVIVIGVIGILAGILIPTFVNLNKKAQDSSDTSFAKNANTALAMGHRRHKTMSEAIADVVANSDISVDDFKSSAGNILVWDSEADCFAIVDEVEGVNKVIYAEGGALKATKNSQLFRIYDDFNFALGQRYSIYASKNWNLANAIIGDETHPLTVGFDVGINDHFVSGHYERPSDAEAQSIILNTGDCSALSFEIDSPKDTLSHFGNADNIHITAIASASYHEWGAVTEPVVIESGRIVLESGSNVTATVMTEATAEKAAGSASSVEYEGHTPSGALTAFRFPAFVQDYLARTDKSRLDSTLDIQSTPEPNRSNFYRNDDLAKGSEGGADIYMVGKDNSFDFPLYGIEVNSVTLQETVYKNPSTISLGIAHVGEASGELPTWNNGVLNPTGCTIGDEFTITLGTNTLAIKIVDGYNITDAKGLSLFDNVSAIHDAQGNTRARYDKWAEKKSAMFGNEYYNYNPASLIQHGDIKLKNTDLPDDLFWSAEQVDTYLRERPGVLTAYTNARNAGRAALGLEPFTELDVKRNLAGSMRDDTPVFYRATGRYLWNPSTKGWNPETANEGYTDLGEEWNGDFKYHGNYFTIDASALKQIAFFGTKEQSHNGSDITPETREPMPELNPEQYSLTEGSHGTLFGFNTAGGYVRNHLLPYRGNGGQIDVYNLAIVGNGNRANDTKYQGGLYAFKVDATVANFHNVNIAKAMGSFMSQIGWYKQNTFKTELHVDRCKSFDSYSNMFYIYGTEKNYLTNSCCKNAGGPLIMLDERNRYLELYEASGAGDHCGFVGDAPILDCTNVYLENYVAGTEPFFASKPPELVGALISQLKGHGADVFGLLGGKNFIRQLSDGNTYMNLLVADMDIGGLAADRTKAQAGWYGSPARGKFIVNNDGENLGKNAYMSLDLTQGEPAQPTILGAYRQVYIATAEEEKDPAGIVFANTLGGHGMSIGQNEDTGKYGAATLNFATNPPTPGLPDVKLGQADFLSTYMSTNFNAPSMCFGFVFGMK